MELFDSSKKNVQTTSKQLATELTKEADPAKSGKTCTADNAGKKLARELSKGETSALEHGWIPLDNVLKELH